MIFQVTERPSGSNGVEEYLGIRTQDFFAWSLDTVSQHRRSAQALIGLGTGHSPSSSGCSPSAQALLSRAQSRSSTLSSEPIMHFLTRPSCRGPLVKFRRRFSGCPVPGTLGSQTGPSLKGSHVIPSLTFTLLMDPPGEEQCSCRLANLQNTLLFSLAVIS